MFIDHSTNVQLFLYISLFSDEEIGISKINIQNLQKKNIIEEHTKKCDWKFKEKPTTKFYIILFDSIKRTQ
jgi:hypothetical protein